MSLFRPLASRRLLVQCSLALIVTLVVFALVARLPGQDRFDASPQSTDTASAAPSCPSANAWGPLAVFPPQNGADTARTEGTLRITDTCVTRERLGEVTLLEWPADRTTWDETSRTITFENFDGTSATVADGDEVVLGGSGGTEAEGGKSGEEHVASVDWVVPPDPSCSLDPWWAVGGVELVAAGPQPSPVTVGAEALGITLQARIWRAGWDSNPRHRD